MQEKVNSANTVTPILFPYEPEQFWQSIRHIIREEVQSIEKQKPVSTAFETVGMTYKPLYKIAEVCSLFHITKPTIYDWVKTWKVKAVQNSFEGLLFVAGYPATSESREQIRR